MEMGAYDGRQRYLLMERYAVVFYANSRLG